MEKKRDKTWYEDSKSLQRKALLRFILVSLSQTSSDGSSGSVVHKRTQEDLAFLYERHPCLYACIDPISRMTHLANSIHMDQSHTKQILHKFINRKVWQVSGNQVIWLCEGTIDFQRLSGFHLQDVLTKGILSRTFHTMKEFDSYCKYHTSRCFSSNRITRHVSRAYIHKH